MRDENFVVYFGTTFGSLKLKHYKSTHAKLYHQTLHLIYNCTLLLSKQLNNSLLDKCSKFNKEIHLKDNNCFTIYFTSFKTIFSYFTIDTQCYCFNKIECQKPTYSIIISTLASYSMMT